MSSAVTSTRWSLTTATQAFKRLHSCVSSSYFTPIRTFALSKDIKMNVILTKDHPSLGKKGELILVAPGYGRNVLIPNGLAVYGTEENKQIWGLPLRPVRKIDKRQLELDQNSEEFKALKEKERLAALQSEQSKEQQAKERYEQELKDRIKATKLSFIIPPTGRSKTPSTLVGKREIYKELFEKEYFLHLFLDQIHMPTGQDKLQSYGTFQVGISPFRNSDPISVPVTIHPVDPDAAIKEEKALKAAAAAAAAAANAASSTKASKK